MEPPEVEASAWGTAEAGALPRRGGPALHPQQQRGMVSPLSRVRLRAVLLCLLGACTPAPDPAERDTYLRLCTAWDAAYGRLQETGDTAVLDPATVQDAEEICSGLAEPAPDLEALRERLEER